MDTQITTYSDDELTAALAEHLASLDRDDSYRVERVLKRSSVETTELVYFEGTGGGSLGPFVRKRIDASAQIGGAYERLFAAQRAGRRFEHLPESSIVVVWATSSTWLWNTSKGRRSGCWWTVWEPPPIMRVNCILPMRCRGRAPRRFCEWRGDVAPVIHRDLKPSNIIVTGANCTLDEA